MQPFKALEALSLLPISSFILAGLDLAIDEHTAQPRDRRKQGNEDLDTCSDGDQANAPGKADDCQNESKQLATSLQRLPVVSLALGEFHDSLGSIWHQLVVLAQDLRMGERTTELKAQRPDNGFTGRRGSVEVVRLRWGRGY